MQDQYIELTSALPSSSAIYGLGERTPSTGMRLVRNGIPFALWNRDNPAADPDENIYGSHPNYLEIREGTSTITSNNLWFSSRHMGMHYGLIGHALPRCCL